MVSYRRLAMRVLGHVPVLFGKKKASPPPRVAAQRIAALALACAMMTGMTFPAFAATYDIVSGSIDIHATKDGNLISQWNWNDENQKEYVSDSSGYIKDRLDNEITITSSSSGTSTSNTVTIDADKDQTANVTLDNVEINASSTDRAAVDVTGSGNTNIELNGKNTLTGDSGHAGLEHNKETDTEGNETSGKLTITDENKDGGTLTATGGYGGAGIGGGDGKDGQVTITGGEITAKATGNYGAGIGGGSGGDGTVTISGGTITEASGGYMAAGIGSGHQGLGTVTIEGDAVIKNAQGGEEGAGIGSGAFGDSEIIIRGNAVIENAESKYGGAGIGSGQGVVHYDDDTWEMIIDKKTVGNVTIEGNAKIENAKSGDGGSGIGGGPIGIGNVIIRGNAQIGNATGGGEGAGIGGGVYGTGGVTIEGNVTIENAKGGMGAAGIGGGAESEPDVDGNGNKISIQGTEAGSPNITAKGGTASDDGQLSGGAAIGSGSVTSEQKKAPAAITIEGKVTIDATAGGSVAKGDAIAIGDTPLKEQKFAGLPVGAVITRKDLAGVDLTQEGDKPEPEKPTEPEQPNPNPDNPNPDNPNPDNPNPDNPNPDNPNPDNPNPDNPNPDNPNPDNPNPDNPNPDNPNPDDSSKPEQPNPDDSSKPEQPNPDDSSKPEQPNPDDSSKPEQPNPDDSSKPEHPNPDDSSKPEQPSQPEQPSEPSGAVSTSAPAEELTASDAEYLITVEGLSVTNALGKQITHSCTQNAQGKVLTIRTNSIVATAHLTMDMLRTLKAQGVETIRFCTLLYRPTSVSIDALLNLGVDKADILWTHNGIQARLTVGGTDSSSLLQ